MSATVPAGNADDVRTAAAASRDLAELHDHMCVCRACPRLVQWREDVASTKRRAYRSEVYWGRPIPGWGDERPRILVVGLAPAAHGGNRTGRIFTGDESGSFLFAALHRAGLARLPTSSHHADGQQLLHTRMLAAVRCAPPANKPTPQERDACAPWFDRELALVRNDVRVILALGLFAWRSSLQALVRSGDLEPAARRSAPTFGHGAKVETEGLILLGSYHPSQQNTFTGRLTPAMMDDVLAVAVGLAGL